MFYFGFLLKNAKLPVFYYGRQSIPAEKQRFFQSESIDEAARVFLLMNQACLVAAAVPGAVNAVELVAGAHLARYLE